MSHKQHLDCYHESMFKVRFSVLLDSRNSGVVRRAGHCASILFVHWLTFTLRIKMKIGMLWLVRFLGRVSENEDDISMQATPLCDEQFGTFAKWVKFIQLLELVLLVYSFVKPNLNSQSWIGFNIKKILWNRNQSPQCTGAYVTTLTDALRKLSSW